MEGSAQDFFSGGKIEQRAPYDGFVHFLYAQKNISAAPAAIIFSLEGVFAAVAAWIILDQFLGINNIIGCCLILAGVLLSQLAPIYKKNYK